MKQDKFEDYTKKGSIKESLNIRKEENSPYSESFVYKKEENKITWTNNSSTNGQEVNSNETKINKEEPKEDQIDQKDIEKVTNATAKVGTAVTTTAAVVTTAVVAIVGVDLVTQELIDDVPQNCQISEVVATSNTVSFTLNIGNDEEAFKYDRGGDCNIKVELNCETYDDYHEIAINYYGASNQTFTGLRPQTEYTLDVCQYSLLDFQKRSVLQDGPYTVVTDVAQTNSISLDIELDPFGDDIYYSTISYKNTLGINLYGYYLGVYNDDPQAERAELMGYAMLDSLDPFKRQALEWSSTDSWDYEPYFALFATTDDKDYINTHSSGNESQGRPEDEMTVLLHSERINIENLDRPQMAVAENKVFARRVRVEGSADDDYYQLYFASPYEDGSYEQLRMTIVNAESGNSVSFIEHGSAVGGTSFLAMNTLMNVDLSFGDSYYWDTFTFTISGLSHRQEDVDEWNSTHEPDAGSGPATTDGGVDVKIMETTINFNYIHTNVIQYQPVVNEVSFLEVATYHNEHHLCVLIDIDDPGSHIKSYVIYINDIEYRVVELENTQYLEVEGGAGLLNGTSNIDYVLYAMSDYNTQYNRLEQTILYEGEDDLSDMEPTYIQGCVSMRYVLGSTEYVLSIYIDYSGSSSYDHFVVYIEDLDGTTITYTDVESSEDKEARFEISEAYTEVTTNLPELQGNYIVETRGYNGYYEEWLYDEIIDFGEIEESH